jgi:hypothetical protein
MQKPLNRAFRPGTTVAGNCRDDVHLVEPTVLTWLLSRPGAGFPPPNARGYAVSRGSKESGVKRLTIAAEADGFLLCLHDGVLDDAQRGSWVIPRIESVGEWLDEHEAEHAA